MYIYLGAKDHVSELGEGKEDNEEHDSKAGHVPGTPAQGAGQLGHCLVE